MNYSASMEGHLNNYAKVNYNLIKNSHSDNLIDMAPHSGEFKKKPVKA